MFLRIVRKILTIASHPRRWYFTQYTIVIHSILSRIFPGFVQNILLLVRPMLKSGNPLFKVLSTQLVDKSVQLFD
jgi:hypothetical protein